jgi:hypothetical protein
MLKVMFSLVILADVHQKVLIETRPTERQNSAAVFHRAKLNRRLSDDSTTVFS